MRGKHVFESQTDALAYFMDIMMKTAHDGGFSKEIIHDMGDRIKRAQSELAGQARDFWLTECERVVKFYVAVNGENDSTAQRYDSKLHVSPKRTNRVVWGFLEWRCARPKDGYLCLLFDKAGDATMYYDLGRNSGDMKPRSLGLPFERDLLFDLSPSDFRSLVEELKRDSEF